MFIQQLFSVTFSLCLLKQVFAKKREAEVVKINWRYVNYTCSALEEILEKGQLKLIIH